MKVFVVTKDSIKNDQDYVTEIHGAYTSHKKAERVARYINVDDYVGTSINKLEVE
jgi:hypothetical protein